MRKNKLLTKRPNKLLTGRHNYFAIGGGMDLSLNTDASSQVGSPGQAPNITVTQRAGEQPSNAGTGGSGMFGGIAQLAGQATTDIIGVATANKGVRDQANAMIKNARGSMVAAQGKTDSLDQLSSDWSNMASLGNVSKYDLGYQKAGNFIGNSFQAAARGAAAGSALGPWGMLGGAIGGQVSSLFKSGIINRAAKKAARRVNAVIQDVRDYNNRALANRAANIMDDTLSNLNYNYAAFGGPMDFGGGALGYNFMDRYFTMKENELLNKSSSLGSLPNFPSAKLNSFGGELNTQGGDFTNGMIYIGNGGSHETNPLQGVPMGIDQEGTPNLVEEGETVFNDYVFSKRLSVPQAVRDKYKLRGTKPMTFAEASKQLAKESEERPNDPISIRGLQVLMSDLASAQEELKARKQGNEFANGGRVNRYGFGTDSLRRYIATPEPTPDWNGPYPYGSNASNSDYGDWNTFTFGNKMLYDPIAGQYDSDYTSQQFKDWIKSNYDGVVSNWWNTKTNAPEYYSNKKNTLPTYDDLMKGMYDAQYSDMHKFGKYAFNEYMKSSKKPSVVDRHLQTLDSEGNVTGTTPITDYFDDVNDLGQTYSDIHKGRKEVSKSKPVWDEDRGAYVSNVYYRDPYTKKSTNRYYYNTGTADKPNYVLYEGDDAPVWMKNNGYFAVDSQTTNNGTDYFYSPQEKVEQGKYADYLRYAPAVGFGIGAITDALGITNKPYYGNADAILEATRTGGKYQPVKFNPVGNYLTYKPFDRQFFINQLNAQAGATRRTIMQNAGLNRGAGMAALLASDYNTQGQMGQLAKQAEEYNLGQRQKVEEFNRGTNMFNSEGLFKADAANQQALMNLGDFSLKGTMAAAQMREAARQSADANKSANLSGLFQTIGDIGFEEYNARMRDWAIRKGVFGPGTEDYGRVRRVASRGGKLKRKKKGLTF